MLNYLGIAPTFVATTVCKNSELNGVRRFDNRQIWKATTSARLKKWQPLRWECIEDEKQQILYT
jgi:hypothetical protein